ncbi:hypothetical protein BJX66DRAFT_343880 [Aspergillus keveii]|uniref:Uncharacterized protein n=1 Tax=Aspergillus keveii TaxID=714993 RepID=A0ABR4FMV0_9EURO
MVCGGESADTLFNPMRMDRALHGMYAMARSALKLLYNAVRHVQQYQQRTWRHEALWLFAQPPTQPLTTALSGWQILDVPLDVEDVPNKPVRPAPIPGPLKQEAYNHWCLERHHIWAEPGQPYNISDKPSVHTYFSIQQGPLLTALQEVYLYEIASSRIGVSGTNIS